MTPHPSDQVEQVIRFSAVHRPQQLKGKALLALRAFIFQHEALMAEAADQLRAMFECGCDDCLMSTAEALSAFTALSGDLRSLEVAHDALVDVSANFDKAESAATDRAADCLRERMIQQCADGDTSVQREVLERLISHPIESDSDAPS